MKHANISIFVPHIGCPNRCSFCNQHTISSTLEEPNADYVRELLKNAIKKFDGDFSNSQIAFFGGSFTAIERKKMIELLKVANEFIGEDKFSSIRISTRPDCINEEILDVLESYSVKSIELGAQSMNDNTLILNHRGHTSDDVIKASNLISSRNFELGLQMMLGLYGDSEEDAFKTAEVIASLNPTTVRIYPTIVLKNTHLAKLYEIGEFFPLTIESAVEISAKLLRFFQEKGIRVIKLGLHASEMVEEDYLAGPYHPAFRELCESRDFLNQLKEQLNEKNILYSVFVNSKFISKALGQKKENLNKINELGYKINFFQDDSVNIGSFKIKKGEQICKSAD